MRRVDGFSEMDAIARLTAQVEVLSKKLLGSSINASMQPVNQYCELCGGSIRINNVHLYTSIVYQWNKLKR